MIIYKVDVMKLLKEKGFSSYRILKEKLLPQKVTTQIRRKHVTIATLNTLCKLLNCQPSDLIEYIPDEEGLSDDQMQDRYYEDTFQ